MFVSLAELAEERRNLDAREAAWLKKVAAYDRSGDWSADGFMNTATALRAACRMDAGVARAHIELARKLEALPDVAAAFDAGDISSRHARVIADAYTPERAAPISNLEPQLVDAARAHTPHQLRSLVRHVTDAIDGDGGATSDDAQHSRRRLHLSRTLDGMLAIDGLLDPEAAEVWLTAVDAAMQHDETAGDTRTPAQRRADAATQLLRHALDTGRVGNTRSVRPHITLVVDLDTLPGTTAPTVAQVRADARRHGHLSAITLERLTCDCNLSRVITTGRSEILDVGRATRTISPAIWKALVIRDQHCRAPHCDRPPNSCEAHHIVHWTRGGPTNLENLQLLCRNHHRQQHNHDAQARAA